MNEREFIELLNLYVDHEISPEDALRLEVEVMANPKRREVYDQYCRIQKACSMLSEHDLERSAADANPNVIEFPAERSWRLAPMVAGLAAAAAIAVVFVDLGLRGTDHGAAVVSAQAPAAAKPVAMIASAAPSQDSMKAVFSLKPVSVEPAAANAHSAYTAIEASAQMAQFNWIEGVHVAPVFNSGKTDFLLGPKADLKADAITDAPSMRDAQEPFEMTAFRFQR